MTITTCSRAMLRGPHAVSTPGDVARARLAERAGMCPERARMCPRSWDVPRDVPRESQGWISDPGKAEGLVAAGWEQRKSSPTQLWQDGGTSRAPEPQLWSFPIPSGSFTFVDSTAKSSGLLSVHIFNSQREFEVLKSC